MSSQAMSRAKFAYVGCFTTEKRKARGKGVAVFRIDGASGKWTFVHACDAIPNPGFIALDRTQRFLYSAHGDSHETASYARDPETRQAHVSEQAGHRGRQFVHRRRRCEQPLCSSLDGPWRGTLPPQRRRFTRGTMRAAAAARRPRSRGSATRSTHIRIRRFSIRAAGSSSRRTKAWIECTCFATTRSGAS